MSDITAIASEHPVEVWAALLGSLALVVGLVSVLYNHLNEDIKSHDSKLDAGVEAFASIGKQLVSIGEQLGNIKEGNRVDGIDMDSIHKEILALHSRLLTIEVEHRRCQELLSRK